MSPFLPREQIAGIGKGRDPGVAFDPRVPADMVEMHMRAQHHVDVAWIDAYCS
jgi:hypothetical protein